MGKKAGAGNDSMMAHDKPRCALSGQVSERRAVEVIFDTSMTTLVTDSGLIDPDEQRWKALLEWLEGHGMLIDEDHLLVRPKHVAGISRWPLSPLAIADKITW